MTTAQISKAAEMAGQWWAERLHSDLADKREAFAAAVAKRVEQELRGEFHWGWWGEKGPGIGWPDQRVPFCRTECDYDPHYCLIEALAEVAPDLKPGQIRNALPRKHDLRIRPDRLEPKEGYGNWTEPIQVPAG